MYKQYPILFILFFLSFNSFAQSDFPGEVPTPQAADLGRYGDVIYRNDTLSMLLTEEGYVTFDERGEPLYHYYLKDHLAISRGQE